MKHETAWALIPDFAWSRLDEQTTAELQTHLTDCSDCRSAAATYRIIGRTFREQQEEAGQHLDSREIVEIALSDAGDHPHIASCESCASELELVRKTEGRLRLAARTPHPSVQVRKGWYRIAAAAAVLVALLGVGGALWKIWVPPLEKRVAILESRLEQHSGRMEQLQTALAQSRRALSAIQEWSGPVQLGLILGPQRSAAEDEATIQVAPDQPFVVLTIDVGLSDTSRPIRVEILRGADDVVHLIEMPESSLRPLLRTSSFVSLLVPAKRLSSGDHSLRWVRVEPDREIVEGVFPFRIER